jgi:diacylglycerol kinase (ATP)
MPRVAFLINPAAGGGRAARRVPPVIERLRRSGVEVEALTGTDARDALRLATGAVHSGVDALIAAGGDGSVNLAVQAIGDSGTTLGIIPLGTGNDNARSFGLPRGDPLAAADVISAGHTRLVDVGVATTADGSERRFTGVLSSGFDSQVNERANRMSFPPGRAKYLAAIVAQLATFRPTHYDVSLSEGTESVSGLGMLVAVGNGPAYGGGMLVCPAAEVSDGLLHVTFLHEVGTPTFLRILPTVFSGNHIKHSSVSVHSGTYVRIAAVDQLAYADGERIGPLPVDIALLPKNLRIFTPAPVNPSAESRPR